MKKGTLGFCSDPEGFPKRLKMLRASRNLTQSEVASKVGVAPSVYSAWEHGTHYPRGHNYTKLALALEVPVEVLTESSKTTGLSDSALAYKYSQEKKFAVLKASELNTTSELNDIIKNSLKMEFSFFKNYETPYKENRVFLLKVEGNSMSRALSKSINEDMVAVIVNEPNIRVLENKVVLIAVENQEAKLRKIAFEGVDLVLKPWNENYPIERVNTATQKCTIFGYVAFSITEYNIDSH